MSLRQIQGHTLLLLQGTPFEMGYRHGSLLKDLIHQNIALYGTASHTEIDQERKHLFLQSIPSLLSYTPPCYIEEMEGIAKGSNLPLTEIIYLNLFPELFHCCGITVSQEATIDGTLYHARGLDYAAGKGLSSSAVLILAKPEGKLPFLNASYAGFIGSVTGMNQQKISLGEIGGKGYGSYQGTPMPFLLRTILEEASCLQEIQQILLKAHRTCEYYYLFGDGKTEESFGCYANKHVLTLLEPGKPYTIYPLDTKEPLTFPSQTKTLSIIGSSHLERYQVLQERLEHAFGQIDEHRLMNILKRPVSKDSNLHSAIFHPSSLTLWLAHAGPLGEPACDQPYARFCLQDFL